MNKLIFLLLLIPFLSGCEQDASVKTVTLVYPYFKYTWMVFFAICLLSIVNGRYVLAVMSLGLTMLFLIIFGIFYFSVCPELCSFV